MTRLSDAIRDAKRKGVYPVIGEVKVRSPRDGDLLGGRDPATLAGEMVEAGAVAVSVVTEQKSFGGSLEILREVRRAVGVPLLRKDFITSERQVREERGIDAILIICSMLGDPRLEEINSACLREGIEPLIEIHSETEIARANSLRPSLIGINNRDILRLEIDDGDVSTTKRLAPLAHKGAVVVSESSISTRADVEEAIRSGADAVLVGTALLKASSVKEKLRELIGR
ncbi:MAG: indole-3-glycerol-phosphate synthase [Candidatus Methanosuratus sp.]|nr:indole-3-glycerol-phosphate synthase [Candidatus Methanosuratincola sp.]